MKPPLLASGLEPPLRRSSRRGGSGAGRGVLAMPGPGVRCQGTGTAASRRLLGERPWFSRKAACAQIQPGPEKRLPVPSWLGVLKDGVGEACCSPQSKASPASWTGQPAVTGRLMPSMGPYSGCCFRLSPLPPRLLPRTDSPRLSHLGAVLALPGC